MSGVVRVGVAVQCERFRVIFGQRCTLGFMVVAMPTGMNFLMTENENFQPLSLERLRETNERRRDEWRARDGSAAWTGADWGNEMGGECGEAQNVVKKLRRIETGYKGPGPTKEALLERLAEELADVIICVDLLAMFYGIDVGRATIRKFNMTSDKQGLETRL